MADIAKADIRIAMASRSIAMERKARSEFIPSYV
jgi:hypothetical protein